MGQGHQISFAHEREEVIAHGSICGWLAQENVLETFEEWWPNFNHSLAVRNQITCIHAGTDNWLVDAESVGVCLVYAHSSSGSKQGVGIVQWHETNGQCLLRRSLKLRQSKCGNHRPRIVHGWRKEWCTSDQRIDCIGEECLVRGIVDNLAVHRIFVCSSVLGRRRAFEKILSRYIVGRTRISDFERPRCRAWITELISSQIWDDKLARGDRFIGSSEPRLGITPADLPEDVALGAGKTVHTIDAFQGRGIVRILSILIMKRQCTTVESKP